MSTTRTFSAMLNDYLPDALLKEEFIRRDFLLSKVDKDNGWLGASSTSGEAALIVAFKSAGASSVSFGSLTASNDVSEDTYVRGRVTSPKEAWGTMIFNHRDIMEHGEISDKNFLKLLPNTVEDFMDYMKNVVSVNLLNGQHFATLTADATGSAGLITVDRPDRFVIDQKVIVKDSVALTTYTGYVDRTIGINMNTSVVKLVTTRGGSTAVDFSVGGGATVSNTGKCYNAGADTSTNVFSSLRGALLSSANGGDTSIAGVTKTSAPYMQAINVSGASITAVNIVEKIFDALTTIRQLGKGNPSDVVMSYKNMGSCMKAIEIQKGAFNVTPGSSSASEYGWTEITVGSVTKGGLKLVGVQEADDDVIFFLDWRALTFYSNGFFQKRKDPDGNEYFTIRGTSGYAYLVDVCLFGELVVKRPSYCGVLYSISY